MIFKLVAVAIVTVVVSIIIKQYRPDLSLLINICGGLLIFLMCASSLSEILENLVGFSEISNVSNSVVKPLIKVVGIGYICEFCADLAEDSGNKTISSKIIFGGKIAICVVALPIIGNMLSAILSLL